MSLKNSLSTILKSGDLCFDLGANVGVWTKAMVECGCRVIAVEPQDECIEKICTEGVIIARCVISDIDDVVPFYIRSKDRGHSTMKRNWSGIDNKGNVEWSETKRISITINRLIDTQGVPQFCKIDVEGMESKILSVLKHKIPVISVEFTPNDKQNLYDCIKYIRNFGDFEYNVMDNGGSEFLFETWRTGTDEQIYSDIFTDKIYWGDLFIRYK